MVFSFLCPDENELVLAAVEDGVDFKLSEVLVLATEVLNMVMSLYSLSLDDMASVLLTVSVKTGWLYSNPNSLVFAISCQNIMSTL